MTAYSETTHLDSTRCFHCNEGIPPGSNYGVSIDGTRRPMCCPGCQAVAQTIVDTGLSDYYRYRTAPATTASEVVPAFLRQAQIYDNPAVQRGLVHRESEHVQEISLILENITCAACVWLGEHHLARLPGVLSASINYATRRARVRWDDSRIKLSEILTAVSQIGYLAHPYDPSQQQALYERERRRYLMRLGVAGALGMQVMVLAVALYGGHWFGMESGFRDFFHWISLLLTTPVLIYSAHPFYSAAWRDLRNGQPGMDVPVTLGMFLAFAASAWVTFSGNGTHVYYDSVTMFAFFLLGARYLELAARKQAAEATENLTQSAPAIATRLGEDGSEEIVPAAGLAPGDRVLVRPGEVIPADGVVLAGSSGVDESLLTGESLPVPRYAGDAVIAGAINMEQALEIRVGKTGEETVLAILLRLLDRAQTEKPPVARLADQAAGWFVTGVLLLASATALYWYHANPAQWLPVTIAVLVVTCPCALSLATPTAITAATGRLTSHGLLVTRGHALESLARAGHFVFDKTGTLTTGELRLAGVYLLSTTSESSVRQLAAALEAQSEHPVAHALSKAGNFPVAATDTHNIPGSGRRGNIDNRTYYIGNADWIAQQARLAPAPVIKSDATLVYLASEDQWLAAFALIDDLRPGAAELVRALIASNCQVSLLSGDQPDAVRRVAEAAGITDYHAGLRPEDKLNYLRTWQQQGHIVAMVGDGINDAPVLGAAQVSVAIGSGAHLAAASADMVLMATNLRVLKDGISTARRTLNIIRQNLFWAVGYNVAAVPLAALGYLAPWMAALGMSFSSLLVIINARRLRHQPALSQSES